MGLYARLAHRAGDVPSEPVSGFCGLWIACAADGLRPGPVGRIVPVLAGRDPDPDRRLRTAEAMRAHHEEIYDGQWETWQGLDERAAVMRGSELRNTYRTPAPAGKEKRA